MHTCLRPILLKLLCSSSHLDKSYEYGLTHSWLGLGLLTSTGDKWRSRRKLITPTFHFRILEEFLEVFNEQANILTSLLHKKGSAEFDIFPSITACALDIICETAMGKKIEAQGCPTSEYVRALHRVLNLIQDRQKRPWTWNDTIYGLTPTGKDYAKNVSILHKFTNKVIQERKTGLDRTAVSDEKGQNDDIFFKSKKRLAFLDMLLMSTTEDGQLLTDDDVREETDTFMFEGHDTTAAAMTWSVLEIGSHPEVQERVMEEIDSIFGDSDRPATAQDLKELRYLECVIKETLRLYPSVPLFGRSLTEDADFGGVVVPKGTTVAVLTSVLHRDPEYFPDPERFDPDRFLPENSAGRHPYAFLPFSAGPRNCIGQKFALMEEKVVLSTLLRKFRIKTTVNPEDSGPAWELILRPSKGAMVKLTPRSN